MDDETILLALVFVNAMTYTFFFFGLKRNWGRGPIRATTVEEAFLALERSVRRAFPDLREGFTWGDAVTRSKEIGANRIDWTELERELRKYEAHRFGGEQIAKFNVREILRLASVLQSRRAVRANKKNQEG